MKSIFLWRLLILLLLGVGGSVATSCSDDVEEEIPEGPEGWDLIHNNSVFNSINALTFDVITEDKVDLLDPNVEGTYNTDELAIFINGKEYPVQRDSVVKSYEDAYVYIHDWDDAFRMEEARRWKIHVRGINQSLSRDSSKLPQKGSHEIVFDWGKKLGKDVVQYNFIWMTNRVVYIQLLHNGKQVSRYHHDQVALIK